MPEQLEPRQRVVRVGRRRAKLTPAPGTDSDPELPVDATETAGGALRRNDESARDAELKRDKPPHWG